MEILDELLVEKYIAGDCSEAEMKQILDWLNVSEDHRKEWLKLRMVSVKGDFTRFSEPEHVTSSYHELQQVHSTLHLLEKKITRKVTLRFLRYAASILVLVGLSYLSYRVLTYQDNPAMAMVAVGGNEHVKKIYLDDGTGVWISPGSKIEYPEKFDKKERKVSIEGKVYFEVTQDTLRPFLVKTESYTVKVLGTSFEVNAYKFKQLSDVTLVEGKVEILDMTLASLCSLQAGQQFEIDRMTNNFTKRNVDAKLLATWHGGELEFDGLTFAEIAKALERQYNVQIILEKGIDNNKKLVGSLSYEKDIHEMMRAIASVISIRYDIQINTIVHIYSQN